MKKVAITGANGFLAGYLIKKLKEENITCLLLTRKSGEREGIPFTVTDYSQKDLMEKMRGCDALVHLASTRKVLNSILDYQAEIKMTEDLYEAAKELGIKNIVYASSISVYSGDQLPYRESMPAEPGNMYGLSKLIGENIGRQYSQKYEMGIKNYRFAHLYGANENNKYMINVFFRQAFSHEQMRVTAKGLAKREFLYAAEAARAVYQGLLKENLSGTFNIGSNDFLTNQEVAETICQVMSPENTVIVGNDTESTKPSYMDNEKAKEILGFEPGTPLKLAAAEIMEDMKA